MTRDEARRRAVEAATRALSATVGCDEPKCAACEQAGVDAIAAYERAMADAGWRMVRDVGKKDPATTLYVSNDALAQEQDASYVRRRIMADANWAAGKVEGWNACRRAMLTED